MKVHFTSNRVNIVLLVLLVLLGMGSFAYNQYLIDRILQKERANIALWARATEYTGNPAKEKASRQLLAAINLLKQNPTVADSIVGLIEVAESNRSSQNFVLEEIILKDRFEITAIIVNEAGEILVANHVEDKLDEDLIEKFAAMNPPIEIQLGAGSTARTQYVYYGESPMVQYLRYFPYIQFSLLALLLGIAFIGYRTINRAEQSNIWVGMTKEAAHQLGTPLSSMYGWVELLREEKKGDRFIQQVSNELENDVSRLQGVAERFNKIGSEPELTPQPLLPLVEEVIAYAERRLPHLGKNAEIRRKLDETAHASVNAELFQWALENILKNSMNAIKSTKKEAYLSVSMHRVENEWFIDIEDSGRGIEKKYYDEIFKPGFSTKKRGWGLGLSLTRRIIEGYHNGRIFVLKSTVGKGTTMRIVFKADHIPSSKSS